MKLSRFKNQLLYSEFIGPHFPTGHFFPFENIIPGKEHLQTPQNLNFALEYFVLNIFKLSQSMQILNLSSTALFLSMGRSLLKNFVIKKFNQPSPISFIDISLPKHWKLFFNALSKCCCTRYVRKRLSYNIRECWRVT